MMQVALSIGLSIGSMCVLSFVILSCVSCRRFIAKRKLNSKQKNEKKGCVQETKIDLSENVDSESKRNGIQNPAYVEPDVAKIDEADKVDTALTIEKEVGNSDEVNGNIKPNLEYTTSFSESGSGSGFGCFEDIKEEDEHSVTESAMSEPRDHAPQDDRQVQDEVELKTEVKEEVKSDDDEVFLAKQECVSPTEETQSQSRTNHSSLSENELEIYNDVVFQGEWRRPVALKHLLETGLIDKAAADEAMDEAEKAKVKMLENGYFDEEKIPENLKVYLCGDEPVAGIIMADSGEKKSIFKSAKEGILRRGTAISLLEAQAATGNIIDPVSGRKVSVREATGLGLLDRVYETVLLRAERAVSGYKFRASDHVLSLYEAMQKGLVVESHGLRLLEAQYATGGIIDHRINIRLPLDAAVDRGLLDDRLKAKLEDEESDETKTFFDPNTGRNVSYKELMNRSVVDKDTGLRLYPLEKVLRKRLSYGSSFSGRSSMASSRTSSRENIPSALASP